MKIFKTYLKIWKNRTITQTQLRVSPLGFVFFGIIFFYLVIALLQIFFKHTYKNKQVNICNNSMYTVFYNFFT